MNKWEDLLRGGQNCGNQFFDYSTSDLFENVKNYAPTVLQQRSTNTQVDFFDFQFVNNQDCRQVFHSAPSVQTDGPSSPDLPLAVSHHNRKRPLPDDDWCLAISDELQRKNELDALILLRGQDHSPSSVCDYADGHDSKRHVQARVRYREACGHCRRRKLKCDYMLPCANCIIAGQPELCNMNKSATGSITNVERPLLTQNFVRISVDNHENLILMKNASEAIGLNFTLLRLAREVGFSVSEFLQAFKILPSSTKAAIDEGVRAIQNLARARLSHRLRECADSKVAHELQEKQSVGRISGMWLGDEDQNVWREDELDDDFWGHGRWISVEYDVETSMRKSCRMGREYAAMFGVHSEECLARFAENQIPLFTSHITMLCILLEAVFNYSSTTLVRYWKIQQFPRNGEAPTNLLIRCKIVQVFDSQGRKTRFNLLYDPVSEEEFYREAAATGGQGMLELVMDHRKRQANLLDNFKREMQFMGKIAYLRKNKAGKGMLDELEKHLKSRTEEIARETVKLKLEAGSPSEISSASTPS
uniref:Zn(2)-C6 fungal-type domain-containing protein n=1 Tax=Hanusia phi TaxID=3032 RepID=A0A7S0F0P6_9CRYP|mmetsp:Transcript_34889/g.78873  ORF Transcript_34889/g.78873 Transcript_34889/m.78873 type:complete len:533 (+) Transcript_34889:113-1711(+)